MDRDNRLKQKIRKLLLNSGRSDNIALDSDVNAIFSIFVPELEKAAKWDRVGHHVHGLAMLVLQSPFYHDLDVKEVVDIILAETLPKAVPHEG